MNYFAKIKAAIRRAKTPRQADALADKLAKAQEEINELRSQLSECRDKCQRKEQMTKAPKFVVYDKYTNQKLGFANTRKMPSQFPDEARMVSTKQWLAEGNSL